MDEAERLQESVEQAHRRVDKLAHDMLECKNESLQRNDDLRDFIAEKIDEVKNELSQVGQFSAQMMVRNDRQEDDIRKLQDFQRQVWNDRSGLSTAVKHLEHLIEENQPLALRKDIDANAREIQRNREDIAPIKKKQDDKVMKIFGEILRTGGTVAAALAIFYFTQGGLVAQ